MYDVGMTDEEAEALLKQLSDHYKQPVMPVQRYCDALRAWENVLWQNADTQEIAKAASATFMAIVKSNMLSRLIYDGEKVRTRKCPIHDGHWSGCRWDEPFCDCQMMENGEYGSNVTGWLPQEINRE